MSRGAITGACDSVALRSVCTCTELKAVGPIEARSAGLFALRPRPARRAPALAGHWVTSCIFVTITDTTTI